MSDSRLNKKIFLWANKFHNIKNWNWNCKQFFEKHNLTHMSDIKQCQFKAFNVFTVRNIVYNDYVVKWKHDVNATKAKHGKGGNKLRLYNKFKQSIYAEPYLNCITSRKNKSAYAKFRCGVAPIKIETGRYEKLNVDDRLCPFCTYNVIEDEVHVLTECSLYIDIHEDLALEMLPFYPEFKDMSNLDKCITVLSVQDPKLIQICSKTCSKILDRKQKFTD